MNSTIYRRDAIKLVGGCAALAIIGPRAFAEFTDNAAPRRPAGYFALQPGDPAVLEPGSKRPVPDQLLTLPTVTGLTIRARWTWLQSGATSTDFSFLDAQVDRCHRLGKQYKLLVMTGAGSTPEWVGGDWHAGAPVPWSPQLREHYGKLVEQLGERFSDDASCVGVHITGPTYPSAEMHPAQGIESATGYSIEAIVAAWAASIDAYAAAFPATTACLSISMQGIARQYVGPVIAYARTKLAERFAVQHNALKASTQKEAPHQRLIADLAHQGITTGYEMVCAAATNARRFGSANVMDAVALGKEAGGVYWDIYPPDLIALR